MEKTPTGDINFSPGLPLFNDWASTEADYVESKEKQHPVFSLLFYLFRFPFNIERLKKQEAFYWII